MPIFDVKDAKKREGSSGTTTLTFTVTRRGDPAAVMVDYAVSNGTAVAPSDFAPVAGGTLSFGVGDDQDRERDRERRSKAGAFREPLPHADGSTGGAAIEDGQGTGTIVNDDTKSAVVVKIRAPKHLVAVHGRVSPARPRKHAVVRLYRKRNGVWVRLATKRPLLRGKTDSNKDGFTDSHYATSFMRAKRGSCKIVASYPGDPNFSGSTATKLFRC